MNMCNRCKALFGGGSIAVMSANHWLPGRLAKDFNITDTSIQLVITRLVTCGKACQILLYLFALNYR